MDLDLKVPQLQRNTVSCREIFFTALGTHPCLCPRISKEWADFREARVSPWYMQTHAFWEGPPGRLCLHAVYSFLQAIAVCFLSEQGREQVGKGTIGCVWHTQVFKILALGLLCSHGARHRLRVSAASCFSQAGSSHPGLPQELG